jgi:hypothetical protein
MAKKNKAKPIGDDAAKHAASAPGDEPDWGELAPRDGEVKANEAHDAQRQRRRR